MVLLVLMSFKIRWVNISLSHYHLYIFCNQNCAATVVKYAQKPCKNAHAYAHTKTGKWSVVLCWALYWKTTGVNYCCRGSGYIKIRLFVFVKGKSIKHFPWNTNLKLYWFCCCVVIVRRGEQVSQLSSVACAFVYALSMVLISSQTWNYPLFNAQFVFISYTGG